MKLFGTDGIRGEAGRKPLDRATLLLIGQAIGEHIQGKILVARDPRESGPWIRDLIATGLGRGGASIDDAGVLPTPAVALLVRETAAVGGVMISASHNPFQDNGIKVFGPDGRKLHDTTERAIESRVADLAGSGSPASIPNAGTTDPTVVEQDGTGRRAAEYLDLLGSRLPSGRWLDGYSITVDCANGAMSHVAPAYFERLGARVAAIHSMPDGRNINAASGAVHPESMMRAVVENGSDFGVAFDGDGDRAMFAGNSGRLVDGDGVLLVLARMMKEQGHLDPALVVGTVMTNFNLERRLDEEGIGLARTPVGDRYIFQEMLQTGAHLGGEPSGHVIFSDFRLSGDGLLTTLKLVEALVNTGKSLETLTADWIPAPQILRNLRVPERVPLEEIPHAQQTIQDLERELGGRGRVLVRYSGTEPLLRVMVESDSESLSQQSADALIQFFRGALHAEG